MNAKHLHDRMVFKFRLILSREQWDTAKQQEEYLGTLQESQGQSLVTISPRQTEIVFSLHDPKPKWITSPTA